MGAYWIGYRTFSLVESLNSDYREFNTSCNFAVSVRMRVFISDLSGATMVVDTHIMPQTTLHMPNFFNKQGGSQLVVA